VKPYLTSVSNPYAVKHCFEPLIDELTNNPGNSFLCAKPLWSETFANTLTFSTSSHKKVVLT